ncbi:MmgE/PrpD family protein [soil metagenome]
MTTIARRLAGFARGLRLRDVPDDVLEIAPMLLADTLACAIAAAGEPGAGAVDAVVEYALSERAIPAATVIGASWKSSLRSASMANCTMARYLDANDIYMPVAGSLSGSGHFSDALPALVATAESLGSSGPELLESVIVAYEVQAALADGFSWLDRGFHSVSQVTVAVALAAGRLMGLSGDQLAHAASLAITSGTFVQSWLRPSTAVTAIKGGAPGLAAERGISCAELAVRSFTGPLDAFETFFSLFGEDSSLPGRCVDRLGNVWTMPRNAIKPAPAQIFTQPVIQCAQELFEQGLRLEDMTHLTVRSNRGACDRAQGSPVAFRPQSREAADHSTPFVTAMTLRDGRITPETYHGKPWESPDVLEAMSRIGLVVDESWSDKLDQRGLIGAQIEARDVSGKGFNATVEQFRGHPDNALARAELIEKLEAFVGRPEILGPGAGSKLLELSESLRDSGEVASLVGHWNLDVMNDNRFRV